MASEELNEVKEMWSRSTEKQEEQFNKFCELQQSSVKAQEQQTVKMSPGMKKFSRTCLKGNKDPYLLSVSDDCEYKHMLSL